VQRMEHAVREAESGRASVRRRHIGASVRCKRLIKCPGLTGRSLSSLQSQCRADQNVPTRGPASRKSTDHFVAMSKSFHIEARLSARSRTRVVATLLRRSRDHIVSHESVHYGDWPFCSA
jgi:hypothetical protein